MAEQMYDCWKHGPQVGDHCPHCIVHCYMPSMHNSPTASPKADEDKQSLIDVSNLRFYGRMFEEYQWQTDVIHWTVFVQTLNEIASRIEAAWNTRVAPAPDPRVEEIRKMVDNMNNVPLQQHQAWALSVEALPALRYLLSKLDGKEQR